ncbi:MAG: hypothetical protein HDQ97_19400 [Lachnospiraceae bacterium]|nr:hypothetical protein [Lachnospiraceae bacterium]
MGILSEKEDLNKAMRMFESLNREHRIAISASIDAYRREEMLQETFNNTKELKEA